MALNYEKKTALLKYGLTDVSRSGFYASTPWVNLRNSWIILNPLCCRCEARGILKAADVVDHIIPLTLDNLARLGLDPNNLQSLCYRCHSVKTAQQKHKKYSPENLEKGQALKNKFNTF